MTEQLKGQLTIFDVYGHDIWSGKTCREPFPLREEGTTGPSSRRLMNSGTVWHGRCLTLSGLEFRRGGMIQEVIHEKT